MRSASPAYLINDVSRLVYDIESVFTRFSKSLSTDDFAFSSAVITLLIDNSPFLPISLSAPTLTPKPSAIACAKAGVCSITELSSAPRNSPLAKA